MDRAEADHTQIVSKAIKLLAAACDHANARDDVGFSKSTAGPGHELAALGSSRWNTEMWTYASRVAAHHSKQLLKHKSITDEDFQRLQVTALGRLKSPFLPTNWADMAEMAGKPAIAVSNSFSKELSLVLARIPDTEAFQPAGAGRLWKISERFAFVLSDHVGNIDILDERVREMVAQSLKKATPDDRILGHHGPIVELSQDGFITFKMPFDHELHAELKRTNGGRFNVGKSWQDVTFIVAPDKRGAEFMRFFLSGRYNFVFRSGVNEELVRISTLDPVQSPTTSRSPVEPTLDISYAADDSDIIVIRFKPFMQSWLTAIKSLPTETRRYDGNGGWRVTADHHILSELADAILESGEETYHAKAAMTLRQFIEAPKSSISSPRI